MKVIRNIIIRVTVLFKDETEAKCMNSIIRLIESHHVGSCCETTIFTSDNPKAEMTVDVYNNEDADVIEEYLRNSYEVE